MKKSILILFIISIIVQVQVFAQETLITTEGLLDNKHLEVNNRQIIDHNVNWNMTGKYQVEYYNHDTKLLSKSDVLVTSKEQLLSGVDFYDKERIKVDSITIKDILFTNNGDYFLYGSIDHGYYPYQSQSQKEFSYVAYFKNNIFQWGKTINDIRYGSFNSACLTPRGIALIGDYDSITEKRNIIIYEISLNGNIVFNKELSGSGEDYAHKIFYHSDYLYFVGESYSKNGHFYQLTNNDKNIIIGKLSLSNPQDYLMIPIGNSGNDIYFDSVYNNNNIYIYMKFIGDGYFTHSGLGSDFKAIVSVDFRLEINDWISLETYNLMERSILAVYEDTVSLVLNNYQTNQITFLIFDSKLNYLSNKSHKLNDSSDKISEYSHFYINNNQILLMLIIDKEGNEYNLINVLNSDYELIFSNQVRNLYKTYNILNLYVGESGKISFGNWSRFEGYYEIIQVMNYQLVENVIVNNNFIFYENRIILNGNPLTYKMIENNVTSNPYGLFSNLYCFESENIKIYMEMDRYYPSKMNIQGKEVYDVGVRLTFNGVGYLNDEIIKNGHAINEVGKYILEINGVSGEKEIISFTVSVLSEIIIDEQDGNDEKSFNMNLKDITYGNYEKPKNLELNLLNSNSESNIQIDIFIILGGLIIGVLMGTVLPRKLFKVRKNV